MNSINLYTLRIVFVLIIVTLTTTIGVTSNGSVTDTLQEEYNPVGVYHSYLKKQSPSETDRRQAAEILYWFHRAAPVEAFPLILEALEHPWPELREIAAELIYAYYVESTPDAGGHIRPNDDWPASVQEKQLYVKQVLHNLADDQCIDIGIVAIVSLGRLSEISQRHIRILCEITSGHTLSRSDICAFGGDYEYDKIRRIAFSALLELKEDSDYKEEIDACFDSILEKDLGSSDPIIETIRKSQGATDDIKFELEPDVDRSRWGGITLIVHRVDSFCRQSLSITQSQILKHEHSGIIWIYRSCTID